MSRAAESYPGNLTVLVLLHLGGDENLVSKACERWAIPEEAGL